MIELKQPNVGPIIGETTANSVRLWGRGKRPKSLSDNVHGVARVLQGATELSIVIFKMTKTWDYTGVGVIEGLQGSTEYEYQFAYFHDPKDTSAIDVSTKHSIGIRYPNTNSLPLATTVKTPEAIS